MMSLICKPVRRWGIAGILVSAGLHLARANETSFDERLAQRFSPRLSEIAHEQVGIDHKLARLPSIPLDDQGGTGGSATVHSSARPVEGELFSMQVAWEGIHPVDLIALVPARRFDERGLDPHYGLPDDFVVELLDAEGVVVLEVARERQARSQRARRGHPFVYVLNRGVDAAAVRVRANQLVEDEADPDSHVHAWAEMFVFEGAVSLTASAKVTVDGGAPPSAPWHWQPEFLIDQHTPLGLPEVPDQDHLQVGWLSNARSDANSVSSLTVELGREVVADSVRLLPARRPTSDLPNGFGFPDRFRLIGVSQRGEERLLAEVARANPGHNPVEIRFAEATISQLRVEATELWKQYDNYPAFFALSEVEVKQGTVNLALGQPVRSSDGMLNLIGPGGRQWSTAALSDGFGTEGKLVSSREWLLLLNQRLELETQRFALEREAGQIIRHWRGWLIAVFALMGGAGAFALVVLPIRYRARARGELLAVRERIAGDLHDEVGSNLGSIQMYADLATGRESPVEELQRIQRIAGETVSAVRDIVWLLRPSGDHRIGATEHLRETASIMLESLKWEFVADELAWQVEFSEEANRHLFLFFREALHNILRHANARQVEIRVSWVERSFELSIQDDGSGIPERLQQHPSTLRALHQRAAALSAELLVSSAPEAGTTLRLKLPAK